MVQGSNENETPSGPLSGYRVLDFGWVLAGALPGMVLADMGAEVIKVETRERLDYMRQGRPIIGDEPDPEQNPMFHNVNRSKLSITLNTSQPEAVELARRLTAKCDVVIENFSPGVMDKLGLGYQELRRVKPDLIMASISSTGQSGPLRDLRAYAPSIGALSGLDSTIGYQGEQPLGVKHAYGDLCGALHAVYAILAALHSRRRTGQGQHIDVAMLRATVVTMGVGVMDYTLGSRVWSPRGNYDAASAPYGNYSCQGEDEWISIAVKTDEEWLGLKKAMGNPEWSGSPEFRTREKRIEHRRQLDERIAQWTRGQSSVGLTALLQSHGVAAMPIMKAEQRLEDPHYRARGLYQEIDHPALGMEPIFNLTWKLSRTPPSIRRHAPLLGQHNRQVFGGILGLGDDEIQRLEDSHVIW